MSNIITIIDDSKRYTFTINSNNSKNIYFNIILKVPEKCLYDLNILIPINYLLNKKYNYLSEIEKNDFYKFIKLTPDIYHNLKLKTVWNSNLDILCDIVKKYINENNYMKLLYEFLK